MSGHPAYYIVRPGPTTRLPSGMVIQEPSRFVPLIAVDRLPPWIEIVGVPRQLQFHEAAGMIAVGGFLPSSDGMVAESESLLEVRTHRDGDAPGPASPAIPGHAASVGNSAIPPWRPRTQPVSAGSSVLASPDPDGPLADDKDDRDKAKAKESHQRALAVANWRSQPLLPLPPPDDTASIASQDTEAKLAQSLQDSKEDLLPKTPCRFWCHTGHCDYGKKCKFVHAMPTTSAGLREVGLSHLPTWWVRQSARRCSSKHDGSVDDSDPRDAAGSSTEQGREKTAKEKTHKPPPKKAADSCSDLDDLDGWNLAMKDIVVEPAKPPRRPTSAVLAKTAATPIQPTTQKCINVENLVDI